MDLFSVEVMSGEQMLKFWVENGTHEYAINKEWRSRHRINFPYTVNSKGIIIDHLKKAFVSDIEVDDIVFEQANMIREKRGIENEPNDV